MKHPHRLATAVVAVLALLLPFTTGCDTSTPGPIYGDSGVRSQTFTPQANQFVVNVDGEIASYERTSNLLTPSVVEDGMVLLYARGDLVVVGGSGTWTALPYTQGIEAQMPDGTYYVDYTITYTYAFGIDRLYIDVISSAAGLVEDFIPNNIPFRLVTIAPGTAMIPGIDYSNYDEVAAAYGLAD
jgi:hypothetical protein